MNRGIPWQRPWMVSGLVCAMAAAGVYGLIYREVVSRAKESYLMGERCMDWAAHPENKKAALDQIFLAKKSELDQKKSSGKLPEDDYQRALDILVFDRDQQLQESSLKYAYQWYKDTFELFSPPESKWVRLAREKAPVALAQWKKELDQNHIAYSDTMFE